MTFANVKTNRKEASKAIRAAYDAGMLVAQGDTKCPVYFENGSGRKCAIGTLFSDEDARTLEGEGSAASPYVMVNDLILRGILIVPEDEAKWFDDVQQAHDMWTSSGYSFDIWMARDAEDYVSSLPAGENTTDYKARFLEMLDPEAS